MSLHNQLFPSLDAALAFVHDFVAHPFTIEHYNIIHPMDENNNRIVVDIHLTIEDNGWRVVIQ